ncbi:MAG: hypothetical protein CMM87_01310 [Rickettsiales bacterium]|nr:hypothetical protein [Rickettsiales bacterium]
MAVKYLRYLQKNGIARHIQINMTAKHLNHGHRQRLRDRLLNSGAGAMEPDELIELILFLSIPRGDVKPIAKRLWQRYGTFQAMVDRPVDELKQVSGLGDQTIATLKTIQALALHFTSPSAQKKPLLSAFDQLVKYARIRMSPFECEHCLIFYLNERHQVLFEDLQTQGGVDAVLINPKAIMRQALNCSAAGILLLHNHPSGIAEPSEQDNYLTSKLQKMCQSLEIELLDHVIITQQSYFSYQEQNQARVS